MQPWFVHEGLRRGGFAANVGLKSKIKMLRRRLMEQKSKWKARKTRIVAQMVVFHLILSKLEQMVCKLDHFSMLEDEKVTIATKTI